MPSDLIKSMYWKVLAIMKSLLSRPLSVKVYEIKAEPSAPHALGSISTKPFQYNLLHLKNSSMRLTLVSLESFPHIH